MVNLEINITQSKKASITSSVGGESIKHIFSNTNLYHLTKALNRYMCSAILYLFKVTYENNEAYFNWRLTSPMKKWTTSGWAKVQKGMKIEEWKYMTCYAEYNLVYRKMLEGQCNN